MTDLDPSAVETELAGGAGLNIRKKGVFSVVGIPPAPYLNPQKNGSRCKNNGEEIQKIKIFGGLMLVEVKDHLRFSSNARLKRCV